VILDDKFSSVVSSVMWGRSVYDNIRKFVQFQLTVNVVALAISLIGAATSHPIPLTAVQLLWVNLIMDTFGALALGTERPTPVLLERRPYRPDGPLVSKIMWRNIFTQAGLQLAILCMLLYAPGAVFPNHTWPTEANIDEDVERPTHHYTIIFNTFVWFQIFNEINSRKVNNEFNIFERFFDNSLFSIILLCTIGMQILMVEVFGDFSNTVGLTVSEWFICIGLGSLSLPLGTIVRCFQIHDESASVAVHPDAFKKDLPQWLEMQKKAQGKLPEP